MVMLIGLPGSGKSTIAEQYRAMGYNIHSSDAIREELSGDSSNQDINQLVFTTLHKRIKDDLKNGINCVYDATNISYKRRMAFLKELPLFCYKRAIVVATPYEVCLVQNRLRERVVPDFVIERMYRNFDMPYYYEGWTEINIQYNDINYAVSLGTPEQFIAEHEHFDQQNKYHTETLGCHCALAADYVEQHYPDVSAKSTVKVAGKLHDNGKPFCKTFIDKKNQPCESAHYYDHEHVGSYNAMFYDVPLIDKLYMAVLIRWHMQMHFIDKQPHTKGKYERLFGARLWKDLTILHKGDLEAHTRESKEN